MFIKLTNIIKKGTLMASLKDITELLKNVKVKSIDGKSAINVYEEFKDIFPFPIEKFAKRFDFQINRKMLAIYESGNLQGKVITVNESHVQERQNFTIGHELGHYFLGHGDQKVDYIFYRSQEYNYTKEELKKEEEADEFSANLLMPAEALKKVIQDVCPDGINDSNNIALVLNISKYFAVSTQAAIMRLKELSYIPKWTWIYV